MAKHTQTLNCHLQVVLAKMSHEIRNDERLHAQRKFPLAVWELFGAR